MIRNFFSKILARYYKRVTVPESLRDLVTNSKDTIIVTNSGSVVMEGLLRSLLQRCDVEMPVRINPGIQSDPKDNNSAFPKDSLRWFPLTRELNDAEELPDLQESKFSTLSVIFGHGPLKNRPRFRATLGDIVGMLLFPRFLIVISGEPFAFPGTTGRSGRVLARSLKVHFYRDLKLVRGAPFQSRAARTRVVLSGTEFEEECKQLSDQLEIPVSKVKRRAHRALREIAANPVRGIYLALAGLAGVIAYSLFSELKVKGLENFTKAAREQPVVIVPAHRSHLDYMIIGYLFFREKLNIPVVAAGVNLAFWPAGFLIRSAGGYFVRRSGQGDPVYSLVLRRYVTYLVKRGHTQEFFIEGGRSRSGKMRPPKLGILSSLSQAYLNGVRKDILIIPISISYETVVEESVYGRENTGEGKEKESLLSLLKVRKVFTRKYGQVIIDFGKPLSLARHFGDEPGEDPVDDTRLRESVSRLADDITQRIRNLANPGLTGLACTSLLMSPRYATTSESLCTTIENLSEIIKIQRRINPEIGENTSSLKLFQNGNTDLVYDLARSGIARVEPLLGENVFYIPGPRRFTADFYKNSVIHLFLIPAMLSVSELIRGEIDLSDIKKLHSIFESDFLLEGSEEFQASSKRFIELMIEAGYLFRDKGRIRFKTGAPGIFMPALLLGAIQSHIWVIYTLLNFRQQQEISENPATLDHKHVLQTLQSHSRTGMDIGIITRTESTSLSALESTLSSLIGKGIVSQGINNGTRQLQLNGDYSEHLEFLTGCNSRIVQFLEKEKEQDTLEFVKNLQNVDHA